MKKMVAFCFVSALCVILTSCAGNYYSARHQTSNAVSAEATLAAETAEIWTRPLEIGFQVMGKPVEAFVESALDEDFSISSQTSLPNVFSNSPDGETKPAPQLSPMVKRAVVKAMKDSNADGLYIIMSEEVEDTVVIEGLSGKKSTAWVRGVPLKMVVYDEISYEKARAHKFCDKLCTTKENCPEGCIFPKSKTESSKSSIEE